MSMLLCKIKARLGLLLDYIQCKKKFCWISVAPLKPFKAPRKIVYCTTWFTWISKMCFCTGIAPTHLEIHAWKSGKKRCYSCRYRGESDKPLAEKCCHNILVQGWCSCTQNPTSNGPQNCTVYCSYDLQYYVSTARLYSKIKAKRM